MFIPVWIVATLIFVAALAWIVFGTERPTSIYDFGTPFLILSRCALLTFLYLIFWIVYLAV